MDHRQRRYQLASICFLQDVIKRLIWLLNVVNITRTKQITLDLNYMQKQREKWKNTVTRKNNDELWAYTEEILIFWNKELELDQKYIFYQEIIFEQEFCKLNDGFNPLFYFDFDYIFCRYMSKDSKHSVILWLSMTWGSSLQNRLHILVVLDFRPFNAKLFDFQ